MMSTSRASRPNKDKTKTHQSHNVKSEGPSKFQATAEQMRIAELTQDKIMSGVDPEVKEMITQVMDVTGRSMDEALVALHDCDNDPNRAINMLLEGEADQGEWQESGKKKKRQVQAKTENISNNKSDREKGEDQNDDKPHENERIRDRDSLPPRRGKQPPRLARKRENEENERNRNESGSRDRGFERGRGRGRGLASGPGRGRGRGRRSERGGGGGGGSRFDRSTGPAIGTWTNETAENAEKENSMNTWDSMGEEWGDEWTGSLEESKVFTSSEAKAYEDSSKVFNNTESSIVFNSNDAKAFGSGDTSKVFGTGMGDNDAKMFQVPGRSDTMESQAFSAAISSMANSNSALNDSTNTLHTATSLQNSMPQNSLAQPSTLGQRLDLGMLLQKPTSSDHESQSSQSQSQFMSQFSKHATEMLKNELRIGTNSSSHTPVPSAGLTQQQSNQPTVNNKSQCSQSVTLNKKPQKSKLPPPSKIPATAVEMPGHLGGNFQLDVQFGNWDFSSNDSGFTFGGPTSDTTSGVSSSYSSTPSSVTTSSPLSSHGLSHKNGADSSSAMTSAMSTAVTTKTSVTGLDSIAQNTATSPRSNMGYPNSNSTTPNKEYSSSSKMSPPAAIPYPSSGQSERKTSPHYSQRPSSASSSSSHMSQNKQGSSPASMAGYNQSYSSSYQSSSYQAGKSPASNSYSAGSAALSNSSLSNQNQYNHTGYQSSSYNSQNAFSAPSHYNTQTNYQGQSYGQSSGYHSRDQPANSYQNSSQSSAYNTGSQNSSYNSGSSQSASYRDSQSAQSAYGSHQTYASSGHQNSLQSSSISNKLNDSLNKMSLKDTALDSHQSSSQYDHSSSTNSASLTTTSVNTTVSSLGSNSAASVSTALGLTTTATSSVSSASASSSKSNLPMTTSKAPPNLPPGVPPIISHNYMLASQPGMPFAFNLAAQGLAQQPAMYSYEELQLLQQRLPLPGYYDMPFQPPTTLTSRDQGLANVPYSATDGKLSRMEAQSPTVQSSQQQQQQQTAAAQQQQFINPTLPPGYNYYYAGGMVPSGYSYTPTVFPVPPVTNAAHAGSTGNPQFQKPGAFTGSHAYGTGYDDLTNQAQDFTKAYGASSQTQNKGSGSVAVTSSTSDISAAAYGKSHTQSFDKTGFAGGTPPPFNMLASGSQAGGALGAPAAAYGTTYVPVMAHQAAHSQMLHHHLQQDSTGGSSRGSQQTGTQAKAAASKSYGPYWGGS